MQSFQPTGRNIGQVQRGPRCRLERSAGWSPRVRRLSTRRSQSSPLFTLHIRSNSLLVVHETRIPSATTGTPKAIVRSSVGHSVAWQWTMKHLYNVHPGEVCWSAADLGWVRQTRPEATFPFSLISFSSLAILTDVVTVRCSIGRPVSCLGRRLTDG